jgi:hypothetical protein
MNLEKSIKTLIDFTLFYIIVFSISILFFNFVIRPKLKNKLNKNKVIKLLEFTKKTNENKFLENNLIFYGISILVLIIINLLLFITYKNKYINNLTKINVFLFIELLLEIIVILPFVYILSIIINYGYYNTIINKYKIIDLN